MDNLDLKMQIVKAIAENDKEKLRELRQQLDRNKWLNQFNGNVPIEAWLIENPYIRFVD